MADSEAPARPASGRDLTTGPIATTLILFALPTLGGNILQSLNGTINAIWIGQLLGEAAVAATANGHNIMFLAFAAVFGLAMATTILIGQAIGARDLDRARRTLGASVGLLLSLALATALVGWLAAPALLRLLATPDEALPLAIAYLRVIFAGMPFTFMTVLLSSALRGAGDAITPLRALIAGVVVDAGLNPFLIAGIGPFPRLGIAGSAWATLVAGLVTTTYLLIVIYARDLPLRLRGRELAYLVRGRALMWAIVAKGVPMGLSMIVLSASGLAMMGLVNRSGVDTAAAFGAISQLWAYVQMPALAIGAAVSAMAAQNIGAGRWDRTDAITWAGCWINVVLTAAMVALIFLVERPLLALFLTDGSAAIPIAMHIHAVVSWSFTLFGLTLILNAVLRANGAVVVPLVIMLIAFVPVRFGFALALHPLWGAEAVWWSFPLGSATAAALTWGYYRLGTWRQARMLSPAPAS